MIHTVTYTHAATDAKSVAIRPPVLCGVTVKLEAGSDGTGCAVKFYILLIHISVSIQ